MPTYIGIIASIPNASKNRVSSVLVLVVVRYDHSTLWSSLAHLHSNASSLNFNVCLMILLIVSTWPLACEWYFGKLFRIAPFDKIIHYYDSEFNSTFSRGHRSNKVDPPLYKGLGMTVRLNLYGGVLMIKVRRWHLSHFFTMLRVSRLIVAKIILGA